MLNTSKIQYTYKKLVWDNLIFFSVSTCLGLIGLPIYAYYVGLVPSDWIIFGFMAFVTMMSTTFGYHRLFAHKAFDAHPVLVFLNLFFGAAAFESSAVKWASQHRDHHRFTDTDRDPYNIKRGFWYAHMDWFLTHGHVVNFDNARDLTSNRMIKHQHDHWVWWAVASGIVLPLAAGLAMGSLWGAFFLGICGRFVFIHQCVFLINSACHMFGTKTYDIHATARDSWVCAFLTHGEGYHSFHHKFPNDYRNGVRWYHWDPTKWMVKLFGFFGLTTRIRKTPEHQILAARSEAERQLFVETVSEITHPNLVMVRARISEQYESLKRQLKEWETKSWEYRRLIQNSPQADRVKKAFRQMRQAREDFLTVRREWCSVVEQSLLTLNLA